MPVVCSAARWIRLFHVTYVWGKLAEYSAAFKKGAYLRVEGELRSREYDTEGGAKVRTYDIVANTVKSLRSGQRTTAQEPENQPPASPEAAAEPAPAAEPSAPKESRRRSRKTSEEARS